MLFAVILIANQTAAFDVHRRMLMDSTSGEEFGAEGAKRNWNNAAVGLWGKRSLPNFYFTNDARAVVKRPQDSWTKLNSLWGKRSSWQTANGLWGKRSGPPTDKRFDTLGFQHYPTDKRFDALGFQHYPTDKRFDALGFQD